jgi:hypothetical protein
MIQTTELRIGNLLIYNSDIYKVSALSKHKVETEPVGNKAGINDNSNKLNFIPLNEEWMKLLSGNDTGYLTISSLERTSNSSDFIILSTIECYLHDEGFLRVCAYEYDKQPGGGSPAISDDVITLGYRHITFVHQLQNLYFDLTGKELTVNFPNQSVAE